jgi:thiamine kinase-like enzyme
MLRTRHVFYREGRTNLENVFYTDVGVKLVDWEHARFDIPEWEIAMFLNRCEFQHGVNHTVLDQFISKYEHELASIDLIRYFSCLIETGWLVRRLALLKQGEIAETDEWNQRSIRDKIKLYTDTARTLIDRI